jgi:hypothetical protein
MALPATKKLLELAKKEKLEHRDRRQCIAFLRATQPDLSNTELAEMFQVSERMIRFDIKAIQTLLAKEYAALDPTVIVADILIMRDRQIANIEKSLKKATLGTGTYLEHCLALDRLMRESTATLQTLGVLPKELGRQIEERYEFRAIVHRNNTIETRRLDAILVDSALTADKEQELLKADNDREREILEAEFVDVKPLPAPKTHDESQLAAPQPNSDAAVPAHQAGHVPTSASPQQSADEADPCVGM